MEDRRKELLMKQMELLHEQSCERKLLSEDLAALSEAMVKLSSELRSGAELPGRAARD